MEKLKISRKNGVALFKVPCDGICPNTSITSDDGLALVIDVQGEHKISFKHSFTVYGLLNPGKTNKLIGGKKPYTDCEIVAVDTTDNYECEWGLGGPNTIPCFDSEFGIDAKVTAFGKYTFVVDDLFSFTRCFPLSEKLEITRADVREHFRTQAIGTIQSYLASKFMGKDLRACQGKIGEYSEDILSDLNEKLKIQGVKITGFNIANVDYDREHQANRNRRANVIVENVINGVQNDGKRDDISVSDAQATVDIRYIDALNGNVGNRSSNNSSANKPEKTVKCPRCGEMNYSGANYCAKCGEALNKK